jgi:hypothetical protein
MPGETAPKKVGWLARTAFAALGCPVTAPVVPWLSAGTLYLCSQDTPPAQTQAPCHPAFL